VGNNLGGTISNSNAAVAVTVGNSGTACAPGCTFSPSAAGGLAGLNSGSIIASSATGNVTGGGNMRLGGLVGLHSGGTISGSFATGAVHAQSSGTYYASAVGGFVGRVEGGTIESSYATGNVSNAGTMHVVDAGGFAGNIHAGTIRTSFATGNVSVTDVIAENTGGSGISAGGFVGGTANGSLIQDS
jgi:hypothetical protein